MNELLNASNPVLLTLFLTALGWAIKTTPYVENKWIPMLLCLISTLSYSPLVGSWTFKNAILGFCIGAGAVGCNQMFRQITGRTSTIEEKKSDEKTNP